MVCAAVGPLAVHGVEWGEAVQRGSKAGDPLEQRLEMRGR
jgi:hypothetical protein